MSREALALWDRALESLDGAAMLLNHGAFDSAASRAYYSAFYAVSALFAHQSTTFTKHSSVESAVHRDLVKVGRWPVELGRDYTFVLDLRAVGDYGRETHVMPEQAADALAAARRILEAVRRDLPADFPDVPQDAGA